MKAALHFSSPVEPAIGIWWIPADSDFPKCHYLDRYAPWKTRGAQIMSLKQDRISWDRYFSYLQSRSSTANLWEVTEVPDDVTPAGHLQNLKDQGDRFLV